ncbi:cullin-3A-like [Trifolium pratense]|uniref:cullin-3A-like n=1 Tax=Trifolium pratense TaxID=57577 RepID=UPI001E696F8C|nr:cullin-3A-like [Trifolium pratense]
MSNKRKRNFQFRFVPDAETEYFDKNWNILEHAIRDIYKKGNYSHHSIEDLYRYAFNMVLHKSSDKLYSGLVATMKSMTSHLKEIAESIEATQGGPFLVKLNRKWNDHSKALLMIGDILMYMDRIYVPRTKKAPVYELGMNLWTETVIYSNQIRTRLSNTLSELICRERDGEDVNRKLIKNITKMLMDLGLSVYVQVFETPFLQVSSEFYRAESQKLIECCNCVDYLKNVERLINEEMDRVNHYLDPRIKSKITYVVKKEMIENHILRLIHMENSGLVNMLCGDKYEDLGIMYNLFSCEIDGLSKICEVMTSHIRESGKQLVTDPEKSKDPVQFVQRLLDEKNKYDKIISLAFNNDKMFHNAVNSSFEFFINLNPRCPEYISLFVDNKLRKVLKGVSKDDVDITLDNVVMLFRYLQDKDMFEKYYIQHLAKRLLSGKSVSDDAEKSLIVKLKTECVHQFTSKVEVIFADMKTSVDTMQNFYASHSELVDGPTLTVKVLTTRFWPTQSTVTCKLPAEISALCEKFRSYYLGTHAGRKLSWQTKMGTADLKATFRKGKRHELIVSTYQMCVLILFNNADRLSYKEIEQATEIPASDLKRCLQSLALVKGKNVLKKEPMSKDFSEDDVFFVNDKFSSKLYKVKIGTFVAAKESELEKVETQQRIEEHWKPQIDAAIVRIMKSRKQLDHNHLIAEVTKQLQSRFLANPIEVKKRIESLIERDFLERDEIDRELYRYIT